jgi:hypothetical protein
VGAGKESRSAHGCGGRETEEYVQTKVIISVISKTLVVSILILANEDFFFGLTYPIKA